MFVNNKCVGRSGARGKEAVSSGSNHSSRAASSRAESGAGYRPKPPSRPTLTCGVGLGGQLARHLLLEAAQHKGPQQALHALGQLGNLAIVALQSGG